MSPELQNEVAYYYNFLIDSCIPYIQLTITNEANTAEGGYQDPYLTVNIEILTANYSINSTNILTGRYANILATVYTYREIIKKSIFGDNEIISDSINRKNGSFYQYLDTAIGLGRAVYQLGFNYLDQVNSSVNYISI